MLISHKHKFLTVDIPKTGTRSLRLTMMGLGVVDIFGYPPDSEHILKQHAKLTEIKKWFNDNKQYNFNDYYKYSVIRNPWDRYFSLYSYYKMKADEHSEDKVYPSDIAKKQGEMSVELFKKNKNVLKILINNEPPQSDYLLNEDGFLEFNKITQFENLKEGFDLFCKEVGLDETTLEHSNKSIKSVDKKDVFTQELVDMVAEKEKWAIEKFNYDYQ